MKVDRKVGSVTDGYTHVVRSYLLSLRKPEFYKRSIMGIHYYYQNTTRFSTIPMKECIDDIIRQFIPDEYFQSLDTPQKETILHNVFLDSVKNFSSEVLCGSLLVNIIDNHRDADTAAAIKQKMLDCLLFEREKIYRKFFNKIADPSNKNPKADMKLSAQLTLELKKMTSRCKKMAGKVDQYREERDDAVKLVNEKNKLIKTFQKALRETHSKLIVLQREQVDIKQDIIIPDTSSPIIQSSKSVTFAESVTPSVVTIPTRDTPTPIPMQSDVIISSQSPTPVKEELSTSMTRVEHMEPDNFFALTDMD